MSDSHLHDHDNSDDDHHHFNPFAVAFFIILLFAVIEFFGGIYTNSLALMGDAGHMLSDAAALGLACLPQITQKKVAQKNTPAA